MWPKPRRREGSIPSGRDSPPSQENSTGARGPAVVALYGADGCHLCEKARAKLADLQAELGFELREVDITGDPELEARYRELIPVVEINAVRAFTHYVQPDVFRRKLGAQSGH